MLNPTRFSLKFNRMSLFFSTNVANINLLTPLLLGQINNSITNYTVLTCYHINLERDHI